MKENCELCGKKTLKPNVLESSREYDLLMCIRCANKARKLVIKQLLNNY